MPFININIHVATKLLDDVNLLHDLLKEGKINPPEFDVLKTLAEYSQAQESNQEEIQLHLQALCNKYFKKESKRAFDLLIKFAQKRQNVSWVLFSRTQQFIHYTESNPLEGYLPRKNEIMKSVITFELTE
jgi:intergrase/recombinase